LRPALMYGLSLSVRFTSAAGEQVEIPAQAIIANDGAQIIQFGLALAVRAADRALSRLAGGFERLWRGVRKPDGNAADALLPSSLVHLTKIEPEETITCD